MAPGELFNKQLLLILKDPDSIYADCQINVNFIFILTQKYLLYFHFEPLQYYP